MSSILAAWSLITSSLMIWQWGLKWSATYIINKSSTLDAFLLHSALQNKYKEIWPCPSTRTAAQGVMKFIILVDPSLVNITLYLVCLINACSREEDIWRNTSILHFLPQNYLSLGRGVMKFTISCLLTLQMLHTKFG